MKSRVVLIGVVMLAGCMPMFVKAKRYAGDGTLRTCSNLVGQGYAIDFPSFPADRPYSASYRVSHVPSVGRPPYIYLRFHSPISSLDIDPSKARTTAAFHVIVRDVRGKEVQRLDLPLSKAIWSMSRDLFGIYDLERSRFYFDSASSYALDVSYAPGAIPPPATELYFEIDGCAYY